MDQIIDASVNGIPIVFVVLGLVTLTERFGAKGNTQLGLSMAIGMLLGIGYMATQVPLVTYPALFGALIFGLTLGLVATGIYETGLKIASVAAKYPK